MVPIKTVFTCSTVRKISDDISIKTKAEKINQKLPISNITPNKDTDTLPENKAESKNTNDIPNPDTNNQDLGRIILPSENLAMAQKITQAARPKTKSKPFEVSTGIFVKGKQKIGNNITTKDKDQKESLSNIFECIFYF
jgi:hypothetical protein